MTDQEFRVFQTDIDGTAVSYKNYPDGSTVVTCSDGVKLIVTADGQSRILEPREG